MTHSELRKVLEVVLKIAYRNEQNIQDLQAITKNKKGYKIEKERKDFLLENKEKIALEAATLEVFIQKLLILKSN